MKKRYFHSVLYTLFFCILKKVEKFGLKGFIKKLQNKRLVCFDNHLQGDGIKLCKKYYFHYDFLCKKCYFHYDFACKKVSLSLRYAKNDIFCARVCFDVRGR
jgi:hypothetical protein